MTIEGGDASTLLGRYEGLQDDAEDDTESFPAYGWLDADDKPTLIDTLEREVGIDWKIHTVELSYEGTLDESGAAARGLDDLAGEVTVDEHLTIDPDETLARSELLNGVLLGFDAPDDATFEVRMEVEKGD